MGIKELEKDYNNKQVIDCPHCRIDRPDHSCQNCHSEMDKEICWKFKGYCSKKCHDYVNIEIPKIIVEKEKLGIKCKCVDHNCAKCLLVNCKDNNCPTHTKEKKESFRIKYKNR